MPISRYKPHNIAAYQQFIRTLVERYDGDGVDDMPRLEYPIQYWEICNEPESTDWDGLNFFRGDPSDYLELLQATATAIRNADNNAVILHGGAAGGHNTISYWKQVFELGAKDYLDVGNIHSITPGSEVDDFGTEAWAALLSQYGIQTFWVTEAQMVTPEWADYSMSEEEQAIRIVKAYVKAFSNGAEKIFYTTYAAFGPFDTKEAKEAAIVGLFGNPKLAFHAMKTLTNKLDRFSTVKKLSEGQYQFSFEDKTIYVLWGDGNLPSEITGVVQVISYLGEESQVDSSTITLTEEPMLIEISK